jgi:hypothetical protein
MKKMRRYFFWRGYSLKISKNQNKILKIEINTEV